MKKDPISITYARALLELADERGELDTVLEEVEFLLGLLADDRGFRTFVHSPGIEASAKKKTLDEVFSGRLTATLLDFLQVVVVEKGRALFLEGILEEYRELYDEKLGRVHVDATTAVALSEEKRSSLSDALSTKLRRTILLQNPVDEAILGGVVLRYGDLVIDGSVRTRLESLANRFGANKPGSELIHED